MLSFLFVRALWTALFNRSIETESNKYILLGKTFLISRAIFFGSNDLVSGSVVAVQEKKYTVNWSPVHSKKSRSLLLLLTKTFNFIVHLEPLTKHKQEIGTQTTAKWGYEIDISKLSVSRKCEIAPSRSLFCQIFPELNNAFLSQVLGII